MSLEFATRLLLVGFVAMALAWEALSAHDDEGERPDPDRPIRGSAGFQLPIYLLLLLILYGFVFGAARAAEELLSLSFGLFLHISVYYAVLLPLLPRLRRHISARACAGLWLLPNYLYLFLLMSSVLPAPQWVLRLPTGLLWALLFLWGAGFAAIFLWKVVSHLRFRRRILRRASPVTDPAALALWESEWARTGCKRGGVRLVTSPAVTTPLSVGLFRAGIRVVLPEKSYDEGALTLILRHELTHICRGDIWGKLFLVFCTAMCWFNPLMWRAMRRSAEDLELSCDEAVLSGADEGQRQRYASLLLSTAGDERGFTTCLSASAEALRYRLKNVVQPRKLRSGALVTALIFLLLSMSFGYVALAYDSDTGEHLLFDSHPAAEVQFTSLDPDYDALHGEASCQDTSALHRYLSSLTLDTVTGGSPNRGSKREAQFIYCIGDEYRTVWLYDRALRVSDPAAEHDYSLTRTVTTYYIPGGTDWDYIDSLFLVAPAMQTNLTGDANTHFHHTIRPTLLTLWDADGAVVYERDAAEGDPAGIFGGDELFRAANFSFSYEPVGDIRLTVEDWDRSTSQTFTLQPGEQLTLPDHSAHYTVCADFVIDGEPVEATFAFDIGSLDDDPGLVREHIIF